MLKRNKSSISKPYFFGFLFGIILVFSQINFYYGLPLVIFSLLILSEKISLNNNDRFIFFVTILQLLWFLFMYIFFPVYLPHWIKHFAIFTIILVVIISKIDLKFIHGICFSLMILLILDFSFNIFSFLTGQDPLGRMPIVRPDDFVQRLGGIFGHSFFSLNISFVGFVSSYIKRNKILIILSILNMILAGSFRGFLLIILIAISFYIVRKSVNLFKIKIYSILFAFSVFAATIFSVTMNFSNANLIRVFAWFNSIENIIENPLFGRQDFYRDEIETISIENIDNYGVTESQYLEIAVHYGIIPALLFFMIMILILRKSYYAFNNLIHLHYEVKIILISAFVIFTDTFYGSIYGSPMATTFLTLLIYSSNKLIKNEYR